MSKLAECVAHKMSVMKGEDLTQKQKLGKAFGICRAKQIDFILEAVNDFISSMTLEEFRRKIQPIWNDADALVKFQVASAMKLSREDRKKAARIIQHRLMQLGVDFTEDQLSSRLPGGQALPVDINKLINQIKKQSTAPFNLSNPATGQSISGQLFQGVRNDIPLIPIGSSNVKGAGVFKNELIVQFHTDGPQKTYRYELETPQKAAALWKSLVEAPSAGGWIWDKIRGKQLGPVWPGKDPSNQTPGGTFASKIPYDVSGRTPVIKTPNFDRLAEEMRKFKTAVKKPPESREPFTMEELREHQRQVIFEELSQLLPRFIAHQSLQKQIPRIAAIESLRRQFKGKT